MATPSDTPPADSEAAGPVGRYFDELEASFARASERTGARSSRQFLLNGCRVSLRTAGRLLPAAFLPALSHLPGCAGDAGLTISCWDLTESGEAMPPPPWGWPERINFKRLSLPAAGSRFRISIDQNPDCITVYDGARGAAWLWSRNAREFPTNYHGAPLMGIFHWWAHERGLLLLHSACVGDGISSVLIVGKGGSGKSTTSLACLKGGLRFLGDDYCLVRPSSRPAAFCLYSSAKLHRAQFALFPELESIAVDPGPEVFRKPVAFLFPSHASSIALEAPLRAVAIPIVTGAAETVVEPARAADAFRSLAPNTLEQLAHNEGSLYRGMAELVRNVPCFRIGLGTDLKGVADAVRSLLERVRQ